MSVDCDVISNGSKTLLSRFHIAIYLLRNDFSQMTSKERRENGEAEKPWKENLLENNIIDSAIPSALFNILPRIESLFRSRVLQRRANKAIKIQWISFQVENVGKVSGRRVLP